MQPQCSQLQGKRSRNTTTVISVLVEKLVSQPIRELCEQKRTVVGVGIGQKA